MSELSLEERIARLETVEAIKRLKYRYWRACDGKDPVAFRACFIRSGASMGYGSLGQFDDVEPIAQIFERVALEKADGNYIIRDMHHGMHPDITILSDIAATGNWTLRFRQVNLRERTETVMAGEYDDTYVVENGAWKMSRCHFHTRWSIVRSLPDDAVVSPWA